MSRPRRAASDRARALGCGDVHDSARHSSGITFEMAENALNPSFYVGYVEEFETVEMIMKKFVVLDEFEKAKASAAAPPTTTMDEVPATTTTTTTTTTSTPPSMEMTSPDSQSSPPSTTALSEFDLQQVFKLTSAFTIASTVDASFLPQDLIDEARLGGEDWREWDLIDDDTGVTYLNPYDELSDFSDDEEYGSRRRRAHKKHRKSHHHGEEKTTTPKVRARKEPAEHDPLAHRTAARSLIPRKVRKPIDPNAVSYVKLPNDPMPSSWAKRILLWVPPNATHAHTTWSRDDVLMSTPVRWSITPAPGSHYVEMNFAQNWKQTSTLLLNLAKDRGGFNGVVLNPPWREPWPGAPAPKPGAFTIEPEDLAKLPLHNNEFLDAGFVYVWSPKHMLHRVLATLEKMNFYYVENAVVVHESAGGDAFVEKQCTYFSQAKDVLLLCRRGIKNATSGKMEWKRIELRHQRISDVYPACHTKCGDGEEDGQGARENKPWAYVHKMCETMLPEARFDCKIPQQPCRLIELWGKRGMTRSGWVSVVERG